jgi:HEAT repeat protein
MGTLAPLKRCPAGRAVLVALAVAAGSACEPGADVPRSEVPATPSPPARPDPLAAAVSRILDGVRGLQSPELDAPVDALAALGAVAVPALAGAVRDPDESVRLAAIEALGRIGAADGVDPLLAALDDAGFEIRLNAVEALGQIGDPRAVAPLLERFDHDPDPQVRYECLTSLGRIGSPESIPRLVTETRADDPYTRFWALQALCQMDAPEAPGLFLRFLDEPDLGLEVRRLAMSECAAAAKSEPALQKVLEVALDATDWDLCMRARKVIRELLDDPSSGPGLRSRIRALARPRLVAAGAASPAAIRAAFLLAETGDREAFDTLLGALESPEVLVRHHAAHLLSQVHDPRAVPALIGALGDPSPWVQMTALLSLKAYGDAGDPAASRAFADYYAKHPAPDAGRAVHP